MLKSKSTKTARGHLPADTHVGNQHLGVRTAIAHAPDGTFSESPDTGELAVRTLGDHPKEQRFSVFFHRVMWTILLHYRQGNSMQRAGISLFNCIVRLTEGASGTGLNPAIARSSGSATLDSACMDAIKDGRFTPALQEGHPVADSTFIAIYW
jgi:Gram-negative bacterial TonB protein C-terminal